MDGRAVPAFIDQALTGKSLTVTGDGRQTRSLCYIDDLVNGIVKLVHSHHPGPINLGNPYEITMEALAGLILKLTGSGSDLKYTPRPPDDPRRRCPDIAKARDELGWEPTVSLQEGLRRTIDWFREPIQDPLTVAELPTPAG
jgi:dTDP-glucose 4,6-dehydratase